MTFWIPFDLIKCFISIMPVKLTPETSYWKHIVQSAIKIRLNGSIIALDYMNTGKSQAVTYEC